MNVVAADVSGATFGVAVDGVPVDLDEEVVGSGLRDGSWVSLLGAGWNPHIRPKVAVVGLATLLRVVSCAQRLRCCTVDPCGDGGVRGPLARPGIVVASVVCNDIGYRCRAYAVASVQVGGVAVEPWCPLWSLLTGSYSSCSFAAYLSCWVTRGVCSWRMSM